MKLTHTLAVWMLCLIPLIQADKEPTKIMLNDGQCKQLEQWLNREEGQQDELPAFINELPPLSQAECNVLSGQIWLAYQQAMKQAGAAILPEPALIDPSRDLEVQPGEFKLGDKTMPFVFLAKGDAEGPRPLFIALHGGGSAGGNAPSPHGWPVNTREWQAQMRLAAKVYPDGALYFIPRMADDNDGRWYYGYCQDAYDRAVREAIALHDVDPNRVYLIGISEGAYTAYRMGAFMADRWAGAGSMAGGEPLGNAPPENMRNVAFRADIGEKDTMFDRLGLNVRYGEALDRLRQDDPQGYVRRIEVQQGRGHGINYQPCPAWIFEHTRNPWPDRVRWVNIDVHGRRRMQSYWLALDEKPGGRIEIDAQIGRETNTIHVKVERREEDTLTADNSIPFRIYLNDTMLDLDRPVRVIRNGKEVFNAKAPRKAGNMLRTLLERGDPNYSFPAEIGVTAAP